MSNNIYFLDATVFNCNFPTIFLFCFIKNTVMIFNYWNHILHLFLKLWCAVKRSQILPIWLMQICVAYQSLGLVTPNCNPPPPHPSFMTLLYFWNCYWIAGKFKNIVQLYLKILEGENVTATNWFLLSSRNV